jgi:hypothetical protein
VYRRDNLKLSYLYKNIKTRSPEQIISRIQKLKYSLSKKYGHLNEKQSVKHELVRILNEDQMCRNFNKKTPSDELVH